MVADGGGVAHPTETGGTEAALRCLDLAGVAEYDGTGRPVGFRRRCRNRRCCPPRDGFVAVHRWDLGLALAQHRAGERVEFETRYVPLAPVEAVLPRR